MALLVTMVGCGFAWRKAPYDERMAFLDKMTEAGITYRTDLLRQGTPISEEACRTGYELLDPDRPYDQTGRFQSEQWKAQIEEAFIKGCVTGRARPKPEPSGVNAVTPVPHGSGTPSGSPTPSGR